MYIEGTNNNYNSQNIKVHFGAIRCRHQSSWLPSGFHGVLPYRWRSNAKESQCIWAVSFFCNCKDSVQGYFKTFGAASYMYLSAGTQEEVHDKVETFSNHLHIQQWFGVIDCIHSSFKQHANNATVFTKRTKRFSINVQAYCVYNINLRCCAQLAWEHT